MMTDCDAKLCVLKHLPPSLKRSESPSEVPTIEMLEISVVKQCVSSPLLLATAFRSRW